MDIRALAKKAYPPRKPDAKKGDFGRVLVIGGSKKYTGAPALSALGALRSGADIAIVAAPKRAADAFAAYTPAGITVPLEGDFLSSKHMPQIEELILASDSVVVGPGLSREKETLDAVRKLVRKIKIPCVIDADALYAIKDERLSGNFVLTPHRGEFRMLSGKEPDEKSVKELAQKTGAVILAKGPTDFICGGKNVYASKTGSPYMTVGGTGDVLTGVLAALLARKISPFEAACLAAHINGLAGERASKKQGEGLIACDLLPQLPGVIAVISHL